MTNLAVLVLTCVAAASPTPRPEWVDAPAGLHGGVYETQVIVGPEATYEECEAKLRPLFEEAVRTYVAGTFNTVPEDVFDLRYDQLRPRVAGDCWVERVDNGSGESTFLHVQLKFDDQLRAQWQQAADLWTTATRTSGVIRGFALCMGLVLVVHLALRFTKHGRTDLRSVLHGSQ